jgi:hypothetical protein
VAVSTVTGASAAGIIVMCVVIVAGLAAMIGPARHRARPAGKPDGLRPRLASVRPPPSVLIRGGTS